jgi:hypothetical protein
MVATNVGRILATAGTESATNIIVRYPDIWPEVLSSASYLSSAFENQLIQWIEHGTDDQPYRAADLIGERLTKGRLLQLLELLPRLDAARSKHIAKVLLTHIAKSLQHEFSLSKQVLGQVAQCVSYLERDVSAAMSDLMPNSGNRHRDLYETERNPIYSIILLRTHWDRLSSQNIVRIVERANTWSRAKGTILCLFASFFACSILLLQPGHPYLITVPIAVFTIAIISPYAKRPFARRSSIFQPKTPNLTAIPIGIAGIALAASIGAIFPPTLAAIRLDRAGTIMFAACIAMVGALYAVGSFWRSFYSPDPRDFLFSPSWGLLLFTFLIAESKAPVLQWVLYLSIFGLVYTSWRACVCYASWRYLCQASEKMMTLMKEVVVARKMEVPPA